MPPRPELDEVVGIASKTTYGSIVDGDDVETAPLLSLDKKHLSVSYQEESSSLGGNEANASASPCGPEERKRIFKIVLGAMLVVALISAILYNVLPDFDRDDNVDNTAVMDDDPPPPHHYHNSSNKNPFHLDPVKDLGMLSVDRSSSDASPSDIWGSRNGKEPLPTNSWYMNLVSHKASQQPDESSSAYTIPYIIDTATSGNINAGIRVHWPVLQASSSNIQMVDDFKNSLTIGTMGLSSAGDGNSTSKSKSKSQHTAIPYRVSEKGKLSPLGVQLEWGGVENGNTTTSSTKSSANNSNAHKMMTTQIVRGMPYATMTYHGGLLPSLYSFNGLASDIRVDNDGSGSNTTTSTNTMKCGNTTTKPTTVKSHLHLHFINSDFTWMVFFSQPVKVKCAMSDADEWTRDFSLNVVEFEEKDSTANIPLTVRVALLNQCTTGKATIQQHCKKGSGHQFSDQKGYEKLLKKHVNAVPSTLPQIDFDYGDDKNDTSTTTEMTIDWGASNNSAKEDGASLLNFALPHHQEQMVNGNKITHHCINTFHGSTCLVQGNEWKLSENVGTPLSFWAPRPPQADIIPTLSKALQKDITYRLSANLMRGAADTYFSGKILARTARVIVIADELKQLADESDATELIKKYDDVDEETLQASMKAAASASLPSDKELETAIEALKHGVRAWLDSDAEAPFVFDKTWGGMVNCGCRYVGKGEHGYCNNTFPDCPALIDVNEDFGNGYYNDHHYHYGYHLYAAAVAAKFDPEFATEFMEDILLYIRDFANPMDDDPYFTQYRQKDWYLGSSWASGIVSGENSPHGRNEESSSEAISAYEAMALFGSAMMEAYSNDESVPKSKKQVAKLVQNSGQLLTATELHATNRYWHVWSSDTHNSTYPEAYKQPVVGMLYDTMASFQTWFAPWAVVSFGIQLLPLTPVCERRDDPEWASMLYPKYKEACADAGDFCVENGWSILQAGLLATSGDTKGALKEALAVPAFVFETQGGMGNSLTNTIWYVATRKPVETSSTGKGSS